MPSLVTRFHLLLLTVTVAITGVAALRVPADFVYPAHWQGSSPDWLWPRSAIFVAPAFQVIVLAGFYILGRLLTKNHYAKSQHILDPALTLVLTVAAATQLGMLLTGIGSDLDFVRFTVAALGLAFIPLAVVLFEAERHTYAGLRMPWPIPSDRAWRLVHGLAGFTCGGAGLALLAAAWFDIGLGGFVIGLALALILPTLVAGFASIATRRWPGGQSLPRGEAPH